MTMSKRSYQSSKKLTPLERLLSLSDRQVVETVLQQLGETPKQVQTWLKKHKQPVSVLERTPLPTSSPSRAAVVVSDSETPTEPEDLLHKLYEALYLRLSAQLRLQATYHVYRLPGPTQVGALDRLRKTLQTEFWSIYQGKDEGSDDCHVSLVWEQNALWIQLFLPEETSCQQQPLVAALIPNHPWVAINQIKAKWLHPLVLSAIESALTQASSIKTASTGLQGSNVYDLFESLVAAAQKPCQSLLPDDAASNPLAELERAATAPLVTTKKRKRSRKVFADCPQLEQVRWDWKGRTDELGTIKCRVTLQGSNVFQGMQALIDAGYCGTLPHYVRDAPSLGPSIRVVNGAVVDEKDC